MKIRIGDTVGIGKTSRDSSFVLDVFGTREIPRYSQETREHFGEVMCVRRIIVFNMLKTMGFDPRLAFRVSCKIPTEHLSDVNSWNEIMADSVFSDGRDNMMLALHFGDVIYACAEEMGMSVVAKGLRSVR